MQIGLNNQYFVFLFKTTSIPDNDLILKQEKIKCLLHFPLGCSLRSKRFRAMTRLETLATQANSVVVKVLRIHFTLECIACNSKGLEKART